MKIVGQVGQAMIRVLKTFTGLLVTVAVVVVYGGLWFLPAAALYYLELFIVGPQANRDHFLMIRFDEWLHSRLNNIDRKYGYW